MRLFIFGSTGDLVRHKVISALENLNMKNLEIVALGRKNLENEEYKNLVCKNCSKEFKEKIQYKVVKFEKGGFCSTCFPFLSKTKVNFFYIALPPHTLKDMITHLSSLKRDGYNIKILMEKPFGENLKDSILLQKVIEKNKIKDDIFISDHYLFKSAVKKIKRKDFNKIRIVSLEKVGLEGRAGYYDGVGALGDMIQNHFLNIVFKIIKNPKEEFKNFKIEKYIQAQYGNGVNEGYVKEIDKKSKTETFVHLILKTKSKEFEFITGKAFDKKVSFIEIDNKKSELNIAENPYSSIFLDFFSLKKKNFPTEENSILAWEIISRIEKEKGKLKYYKEGSSSDNMTILD